MFLKKHGGKRKTERFCLLSILRDKQTEHRKENVCLSRTQLEFGKWTLRAVWLFAVLLLSRGLWGQNSSYNLNQHKALYLFNFAKYTEWPPGAFANSNAPFVLGILGKDPFQSDLDIIKEKSIKGRKLVIKYCNSVQEVSGCHLVFICSSETNHLSQITRALGPGILTIAEADGFLEKNGMINLISEQKTPGTQVVNFEINQEAAKKANLKLDTQLLKLARKTKNS